MNWSYIFKASYLPMQGIQYECVQGKMTSGLRSRHMQHSSKLFGSASLNSSKRALASTISNWAESAAPVAPLLLLSVLSENEKRFFCSYYSVMLEWINCGSGIMLSCEFIYVHYGDFVFPLSLKRALTQFAMSLKG